MLKEFFEIRGRIEFINTFDNYENYKIYLDELKKIKGEENIDEKILEYFRWEREVLRLREEQLHTTINCKNRRFNINKSLGSDRDEFYEEMLANTESDYIRYRYLDYLIEFGSKSKRYLWAKEITTTIKRLLIDVKIDQDMYYVLSPISRLVDISVSFNMKDEIIESISIIKSICEELRYKSDYRWCLELIRLIRYAAYQKRGNFIDEKTELFVLDILFEGKSKFKESKSLTLIEGFILENVEWYKKQKNESEIMKLILELGKAIEVESIHQGGREVKSSMVEAHFLEKALKLYMDNGFSNEADILKVKIKMAYDNWKKNEARVIKHDFTIETKKLEQHYELFRMDEVSESLNKAISSMYHVPIVNLIENELNEQEKNTDLMDFVSIINVKNNRKVFGVGDEENRKKRNFYSNYGLGLSINFSIFFKYIWEQLIADGLTLRMVKEKMLNWEYFEEDTKKIIEVGVERFWNEDYVSAIHILVPQFENSFRTFFHLGKNPTTVIRKETTQQEQVFGQFLEQKFVKDNIDENMLFMIKYVLTEELGYNLRNNIAHGLESLENMDKGRTLIIIYLYLLMTLYRWEVKNEDMN